MGKQQASEKFVIVQVRSYSGTLGHIIYMEGALSYQVHSFMVTVFYDGSDIFHSV